MGGCRRRAQKKKPDNSDKNEQVSNNITPDVNEADLEQNIVPQQSKKPSRPLLEEIEALQDKINQLPNSTTGTITFWCN